MLEDRPYRAELKDETFAILDERDREILACRDEASAGHYVALLTEAYRKGYRKGFRDARKSAKG